ncbi:hypothetical protein [Bradyrhizobium sp. STM 3562]|uniref:hypothetical protein n=1 Tax=Bradyrhizobium sp. STM 3562 TaxID=578924 RepID=UPI00388DA372
MSYLVKGIFGAAAISLTLGAVQFASGHDLSAPLQALSGNAGDGVNRAAKADRASVLVPSLPTMRTIAFRPAGLSATSVLVRIPVTVEAREAPRKPTTLFRSTQQKPMVACEPMVSVLTEVAKRLQPGRCVT